MFNITTYLFIKFNFYIEYNLFDYYFLFINILKNILIIIYSF